MHWNCTSPCAELIRELCAYSTHTRCMDQEEGCCHALEGQFQILVLMFGLPVSLRMEN